MRIFESGDWTWINDGEKPTAYDFWKKCDKKTCVDVGVDFKSGKKKRIGYAPKDFYLENSWNVIFPEDFYEKQPNVTPKKRAEINAYFDWKEKQKKTDYF